jgi:hypothetical protein
MASFISCHFFMCFVCLFVVVVVCTVHIQRRPSRIMCNEEKNFFSKIGLINLSVYVQKKDLNIHRYVFYLYTTLVQQIIS